VTAQFTVPQPVIVVTILFLQIATDDRIGITVLESPGELPVGSSPTRFEDDN
jgi:hypothetical protein